VKILFIQNRILFPTNTGGRIRTLNVLRHLAQWHDVTYLCSYEPKDEPHLQEMRDVGVQLEAIPFKGTSHEDFKFYWDLALNTFSKVPFTISKDFNPAQRARAEELLADGSYDLVVCDFIMMVPASIDLPCKRSLLFEHNVEAQIFERHAKTDKSLLRRRLMYSQWKKMFAYEKAAGKKFDRVIAVSEEDKAIYERDYGWDHVDVIDTAVDVDFFKPLDMPEVPNRVAFVASMDWLPNQDGAEWFVEKVWPIVKQKHPELHFQIVGRNPSPMVQNLAQQEGVEVLGTVPDVRPYLTEAAVVVVPILVGGGTRIKIYEAMAMGNPVVSTTIGAEGLKVTHDADILLGDTVEDFAAHVCRLIENAEDRQRIGQAARDLVCENFSAEVVARQFEAICQKTVG